MNLRHEWMKKRWLGFEVGFVDRHKRYRSAEPEKPPARECDFVVLLLLLSEMAVLPLEHHLGRCGRICC